VAAVAVAGLLFARRALFLIRLVRAAKPLDRSDDIAGRIRNEATIVLGQRKLFQRLLPGVVHALIFWGFIVLFPTIVMAMVGAIDRAWSIPWLGAQGWFVAAVDVFVLTVLTGVVAAAWIRKVVRPARFKGSHLGEADFILAMIALVVLTLLGWHAARIAAGLNEWPAHASFLSNWVSSAVPAPGVFERLFVWAHVVVILTFLAYLPHSKHLHIATAGLNVYFSRTRRRGRLEPLRFDLPDDEIRFGAGTIGELTWKEMVDSFSCTECGRCQDVCPAYATGKQLSPKLLIMGIRDQVFAEGANLLEGGELSPIAGNGVPEEMIWDCVTCGACVHECPVSIEHVDHIVDLRRDLVMMQASFPQEAETMLRDVERVGNPWGKPQGDRASWAEDLGVRVLAEGEDPPEVLYWVGCAAAYDERARVAAESTAKLLQKAGVDFAILGAREACTGDPARRMGNEYVFQQYAEQNIATLDDARVTKIVASCPHCLNSLGNEYPDFGGRYEVMHHTQLLAELVRDGKLQPKAGEGEITYHDSCYLARHNDVRDEPRELVASVGKPIEMSRNRERTFCCGAGGAHMWMEERGTPINEERVREASETGAETLAVACPFCTVMLDDGVRSMGKQLRVVDVSTLLVESMEA
jgi:Fe-S oxidoreductase